jgi:uncharacterized protein (TIGR00255 family)
MTGYGHTNFSNKDFELDIQVKSVNGRFLDIRLHLPREYNSFESEIKKSVSQVFHRGTIDIYCGRKIHASAKQVALEINDEVAKLYVKSLKSLAKNLKLKDNLSLDMIIKLPELMQLKVQDKVSAAEKQKLMGLVDKAIEQCEQERIREAKALSEDIENNLLKLKDFISEGQKLREQVNLELAKKFEDRIKNLSKNIGKNLGGELAASVDPGRLAQEVIMQIDRSDINEEMSRLSEHVAAYLKLLTDQKSNGKKMDFYAQELLREVNTIGSKSQVAKMTALVVEAKSLIERIREQVQNVE